MATVTTWNNDMTQASVESPLSEHKGEVRKTKSGWVWGVSTFLSPKDTKRFTFARGACETSRVAIANCALYLGEVDP